MKKYTNIVLLAVLAALFYKTPKFLIESVSEPVGKLAWMVIIFVVYQMLDKVSAVILAIIMITLMHQNITEGFEDSDMEKSKEDILNEKEMEEKEMEENGKKNKKHSLNAKTKKHSKKEALKQMKDKASKKGKVVENEEEIDGEIMEEEEPVDDVNEEEIAMDGKEGFASKGTLIKKTKSKCNVYNRENFSGFTELLKKFKIPVTTNNTTDLDRELKISSERSTINSSKE